MAHLVLRSSFASAPSATASLVVVGGILTMQVICLEPPPKSHGECLTSDKNERICLHCLSTSVFIREERERANDLSTPYRPLPCLVFSFREISKAQNTILFYLSTNVCLPSFSLAQMSWKGPMLRYLCLACISSGRVRV